MAEKILYRLTKCDSGLTLNPLMHVFIFVTFVFGVAFVIPGSGAGLASSVLFIETMGLAHSAVNLWGVCGVSAAVLHVTGLLWRGKVGIQLMRLACALGFFMWLWAAIIYLQGGFIFQFMVGAVPNLMFWTWYAWQWRRRYQNKRVAFV